MNPARFSLRSLTPGRLAVAFVFLAGAATAAAADSRTVRYGVELLSGRGGQLVVQTDADGTVRTDYRYRDNGRGPDVKEVYRLDASGRPVRYEAQGTATFGATIEERYAQEGDTARWTSRVDRGEATGVSQALFVPLDASPAYMGQLISVLLRQPGQPVPLVVAGQAQAEVVHRHPRSAGEPALLLVAVTGLDAQPIYAWVSDEPGHPLFALLNIGWALIRDGQAALAPELLRRQQTVDDERLFRLRRELAQPLHGLTLIRAVRWFDAKAATLKGPSDVWLLNGRIWRITAPGAWSAQADQVIEGTVDGKAGGAPRTLLPGLFDMHGHLTREDLILHLAGGVTTVRDQGNTNGDLLRMKARVEAGLIIGPHIVPSGFIEGQSDFASQTGIVVDSVEAGRAAVDWYHARGYRAIKLYNSIRPEWVKPLAAHAKSLGLRVTGHVPAFMRAGQAVDAGFDELTHINQVMLNFVMREGDDTRTLTRFTRVGDESHAVKLSEPRVQAFLRQIGSRKLSVDPTLVAFEAMFTQSPGEENPSFLDIKPNLPATWQRRSRVAEMEITGERLERNRASFQRMLELTRAMHRSGARIVPGTDSLAGLGLHQELALYVRAGLSPAEALRSATWVSAEVAGELKERGSIEVGKRADLILVDGDPTRDVLQLRRTSLVLTDGVAYSPAALYRAVGFKPFVEGATVSTTDGADSAGRSGGGRHRHQHLHQHHH